MVWQISPDGVGYAILGQGTVSCRGTLKGNLKGVKKIYIKCLYG